MITEHNELPKDIQDAIDNRYRDLIEEICGWERDWYLHYLDPTSPQPISKDDLIEVLKKKYHVSPNKFYKKEQ